jgi:CotH kinase protein/Lamin Tail Domain/Right handed beta helix region/Secretion system C-terminal sorting domain
LLGFHHDAGASVGGENSWVLPQKLFNISSRKIYGGGTIAYQIFPDNPRKDYGDLIMRTSGNDWSNTLFRDGMMQNTAGSTADLDMQSFRPVATFINGKFYGIHNLREKQDKDYAEIHHGITPDSLDYIENDAEIKEGDAVAYQQMMALLNTGLETDAKFQNYAKVVDIQNFTDYIQSEIFVANTSWGHNIALFRKRSPEAKWRWFPHDYDRGFNLAEVGGTGMDWATATNGLDYSNAPFATLFLRKMLENSNYKAQFIQRFADHLFVTWNPLWVNPRIDRHSNWIKNEIPNHVAEWTGSTSSYGDGISTVAFWQSEVSKLKDFAKQRNDFMLNDLSSFFSLTGVSGLTVQVSDPAHGRVRLHEMPALPTYPWVGKYLKNQDFTLIAEARPGFKFVRWEKIIETATILLPADAPWKYRDVETAPSANWNASNFDDASWATGNAQLGYGEGDEATVLNYGANPDNKTIAYYFRKKITVANPTIISQLVLKMVADDGAVVYLNGTEVWRHNMPSGTIGFSTLSNVVVSGNAESAWNEWIIPANLLVAGENTIAIEVHQTAANSSDVSFNFEISSLSSGTAMTVGTNASFTASLTTDNPTTYKAVFESNGDCGFLPDTIAQNLILTLACSPYIAAADVVILPSVTMTVEAGVEIRFPEKANLWVQGDLQINGTINNGVKIHGTADDVIWGGILLQNTTAKSKMKYLTLENAKSGEHRVYFPAAISAYHADLDLDHLTLTKVTDNPIYARFSDVTLTNSDIRSVVTGDGINLKQGKGRVENCTFTALGTLLPDMDAIDFDGITDGVMRNNVIHDFRGDNCDGLDIGEKCQNLQIEGNFIYHCFDKGISVGQESSATIRNNTIAYTAIGIALKDQSPVLVDHCTIFGTQQGISAYEKNPGSMGGIGIITNCIVSNAAFDAYIADTLSSITLSNCLSGTDTITGLGNQTADPHFVNPTKYDFHLKSGSPAIAAGTNGSNLGANPLPTYTGQPQVMFSEILYNDTLTTTGEFLELHNPGSVAVDLSGYTLVGAVSFTFPNGTSIAADEYLVVAENAANFPAIVPYQVLQWTLGKLKDTGEKILLFDATGVLADFVRYNNHAPWPEGSTLLGKSLELVSSDLDNHFASSWQASAAAQGSPGEMSGVIATHSPNAVRVDLLVYPNPTTDFVTIGIKNADIQGVLVEICDLSGRIVFSEKTSKLGVSSLKVNLSGVDAGAYLVRVLGLDRSVIGVEKLIVE